MSNSLSLLKKIRNFMKSKKCDVLIVNSTDEFLNEYIELNKNARYLITEFSGSTGDAIVTQRDVFLFVDGRYHKQADREVNADIVTVVKVPLSKSPQDALFEKILELANSHINVGLVAKKISCAGYRRFLEVLSKNGEVDITEFDYDPVLKMAEAEGEKQASSSLRIVPESIAGLSPQKKLENVLNYIKNNEYNYVFVSKPEEIAYLTNLRGNEIPYSSSFRAKLVLDNEKAYIFTSNKELFTGEILKHLGDRFEIKDSEKFSSFIMDLKNHKSLKILYSSTMMNLYDCRLIERLNQSLIENNITFIGEEKSIKNDFELNHMKECYLSTDIVFNRVTCWLEQSLERGLKVSEKDVQNKVIECFYEEGAFGLSFEPITASGKNSAFIHYTNPNEKKFVEKTDFVLIDAGAYFEGGYATDVTRTILAGGRKANAEALQQKVYTLVLKAFLNGLYFELKEDTTGFDIDKKVREVLEANLPEGFKFAHGTGHGVGISVHELPPRISPSDFAKEPLKTGMCFTIEPGLYNDEWGGVRLENTVFIAEENGKRKIETFTHCDFDESLIDYSILSEKEIGWLNDYRKKKIG